MARRQQSQASKSCADEKMLWAANWRAMAQPSLTDTRGRPSLTSIENCEQEMIRGERQRNKWELGGSNKEEMKK